jgi:hypothetical protein
MSDNPISPLSVNLNVNEAVRDLGGFLAKFKENRTYDKSAYTELLGKYVDALKLIDQLQVELAAAQASKMPSADDIENMGKALGMLDQLSDALPKLTKLQRSVGKINRR